MSIFGLYLRDLSHERTQSHGIVNYALGLANALPDALRPDERLIVFANAEIAPSLPQAGPRVTVEAGAPPPRRIGRMLSDQVAALAVARRRGVSLLHFPKGFIPLCNPSRMAVVATLHDDIPLRYWEGAWGSGHRSAQTGYFAANVVHAARRADAVITVSDFTAGQLRRRWPSVDAHVTGQAVSLPPAPYVPLRDRAPVAVIFGSSLPHKRSGDGVARMLRWIDENPGHGIDEVHVVGADAGLDEAAPHPRLRLLGGGRSNAEIARLIAGSRLLVFPSEYEGFGLPPLEAGLLGTPVVFARIPVVTEVLGDDAPGGYDSAEASFDDAVSAALAQDDDGVRLRARELGRRHRWEDVAARTLAVYRQVLPDSATGP